MHIYFPAPTEYYRIHNLYIRKFIIWDSSYIIHLFHLIQQHITEVSKEQKSQKVKRKPEIKLQPS